MHALSLVMAVIFAIGGLVQINDPDPVAWMGIYLAGAVASYRGIRHPGSFVLPAVVGAIAILWATFLTATVPVLELFQQWEMRSSAVEETREFYGLSIIAVWMAVLLVRALLLRRRQTAPA